MPSMSATRIEQNGFTMFHVAMSGKDLLDISRVSRRHEDSLAGFNRALSSTRAREIARYLDVQQMPLPTNLIVSAQKEARLAYRAGKVSWVDKPGAFLVLDGQHRLFSMQYTQVDYVLPVAIFDGLTPKQEVQLFIDINTNQIGVPPALLLDIKQLAGIETSEEERLRRIFDIVGSDRSSPLRGLMSPAATKAGMVSRVTFNTALKGALNSSAFAGIPDVEDQARLVINYLIASDRAITASKAKKNRLTKATILQAFFEVLDLVVDETISRSNRVRPDDLSLTMAPLGSIDFDSYIGSNRPSKSKLVSDMRAVLASAPSLTREML